MTTIEASSTHVRIEYHWSDFKRDPLDVLHSKNPSGSQNDEKQTPAVPALPVSL